MGRIRAAPCLRPPSPAPSPSLLAAASIITLPAAVSTADRQHTLFKNTKMSTGGHRRKHMGGQRKVDKHRMAQAQTTQGGQTGRRVKEGRLAAQTSKGGTDADDQLGVVERAFRAQEEVGWSEEQSATRTRAHTHTCTREEQSATCTHTHTHTHHLAAQASVRVGACTRRAPTARVRLQRARSRLPPWRREAAHTRQ